MKIAPLSLNYINFQAKNKNTKKADDIARKTRLNFPMTSATYIDDFYFSAKPASKNWEFARGVSEKIHREIMARRKSVEIAREMMTRENDLLYAFELGEIAQKKTGNCQENAKVALAVLFANEFYNSKRMNVYLDINFVNKVTGECEYSKQEFLNHCVVLTDMNKGGKRDIVIDPWLGFADNIQAAAGRYKQLYDGDLDIYENMHRKLFLIEKLSKNEEVNLDDYDCNMKFAYIPFKEFEKQTDKEKLGFYIKTDYPGVLLKGKKN